jgi:hypothetical protein
MVIENYEERKAYLVLKAWRIPAIVDMRVW